MGFGFEVGFRVSGLGRWLRTRLRGEGSEQLIKAGNPQTHVKGLQCRYNLIRSLFISNCKLEFLLRRYWRHVFAIMSSSASPTRERSLEQGDEKRRHGTSELPSGESTEAEVQDTNQQSTYDEHQWITGVPLFTVMGAICLVCFLMLLDTSIIATVPIHSSKQGFFSPNKTVT